MSFVIMPELHFTENVEIHFPGEECTTQILKTTFRFVPEDHEFKDASWNDTESLKGFLRLAIVTFHDVLEPDEKTPRPHSEALVEEMLSYPFVRVGLMAGYGRGAIGAKKGN